MVPVRAVSTTPLACTRDDTGALHDIHGCVAGVARKDLIRVRVAQSVDENLAQHAPIVSRDGEVAAVIEVGRSPARPLAANLTAIDR